MGPKAVNLMADNEILDVTKTDSRLLLKSFNTNTGSCSCASVKNRKKGDISIDIKPLFTVNKSMEPLWRYSYQNISFSLNSVE